MRVSISYFDQILEKKESQTRQIFNFAILKLYAGTKFLKNWLEIAKFNTFKAAAQPTIHQKSNY